MPFGSTRTAAAFIFFSAVAPPGLARPKVSDSALESRIDALARPQADAERFSGIILIARGDRIAFERAYGFADWELRAPNSRLTRFGIGSITKEMTETILEQLGAEGRLDFAAPVAKYIEGFPNGPKGGVPTVGDLMTHRAGVPFRVTADLEENRHYDAVDIVERVKKTGLLFEPGAKEYYSSAGFTCLARVVELLEKKPFDRVLTERIFKPASMAYASDETGEQLLPGRAGSHRLSVEGTKVNVAKTPYQDLTFITGAGSVYATAEDLLHFVRALHDGRFGKAGRKRLGEPGDPAWNGMYGRTDGYESSVDYLASQDLTLVLLTNLRSASTWQTRRALKILLEGGEAPAIAYPPAVAPRFEPASLIEGAYGDPADPVIIREVRGRLFRDETEIYPIAGALYTDLASGSTMHFVRAADGTVDAVLTRYEDGAEREKRRIRPRAP